MTSTQLLKDTGDVKTESVTSFIWRGTSDRDTVRESLKKSDISGRIEIYNHIILGACRIHHVWVVWVVSAIWRPKKYSMWQQLSNQSPSLSGFQV